MSPDYHLFENGNIRIMCEIRSNLTRDTRTMTFFGAFIVNFGQIPHFVLMFSFLALNK